MRTQAVLPPHLIVRKVSEMEMGDEAYVSVDGLWVNNEGKCWLASSECAYTREQVEIDLVTGTAFRRDFCGGCHTYMTVRWEEDGFIVDLSTCARWDIGWSGFRIDEEDIETFVLVPVVEIVG